MTPEEWWADLLQSSLGALIGLVGLLLVFSLTQRHERALQPPYLTPA